MNDQRKEEQRPPPTTTDAGAPVPSDDTSLTVGPAGPVLLQDTYLNEKLRLTEEEIVTLSPMRLAPVDKPLAFALGTAELPPLMSDSQELHALRSAEHMPGALIPVPRANYFTIVHELRDPDGVLTRHLPLLLPER